MIKDLKLNFSNVGYADNDFNACIEKEEFLKILENSNPKKVNRYSSKGTSLGLSWLANYYFCFNGAKFCCTDYVDHISTFLIFLTQLAYYDDKSLMCSYDDEGVENIMIAQPQDDNFFRISIFEYYREYKLLGDFIIKKDTFLKQIKSTLEKIIVDWDKVKEKEPRDYKAWDVEAIQKCIDYLDLYFTNKKLFRKIYNPIKHFRVFDIAYKNLNGVWEFYVCLDDDKKAYIEYWEKQKQDAKILDFDYEEQTPTDSFVYDVVDINGYGVANAIDVPRKLLQKYLKPNMEKRIEEKNWVYSTEKQMWYATNEIMDMPDENHVFLQSYENFEFEIASSDGWSIEERIKSYLEDTDVEKDEYGSLDCILLYIKDDYYKHHSKLSFEFDYGYNKEIREALKKLENNEESRFNITFYNKMHIWTKERNYVGDTIEKRGEIKVAVFSQNANNPMKDKMKCYFSIDKLSFIQNFLSILDKIDEKIQKVKQQQEIEET